jgi:hypothetical protein
MGSGTAKPPARGSSSYEPEGPLGEVALQANIRLALSRTATTLSKLAQIAEARLAQMLLAPLCSDCVFCVYLRVTRTHRARH